MSARAERLLEGSASRRGVLPAIRALIAIALIATPAVDAGAVANGSPVGKAEFEAEAPWAVALVGPSGGSRCSGSLISPRFVLTAAHCASPDTQVLIDSPVRSKARRVAVREAIRHPRYVREPIGYDLGLLRLVRPVRATPVPVASRVDTWSLVRATHTARFLGWGRVRAGAPHSDVLQSAAISLTDVALSGTHLAIVEPGAGPCGGDSGGALVVADATGQWVLVGVASVAEAKICAEGGGLAGYTDVAKLRDFILEHVDDLPDRAPPLDFEAQRQGPEPAQAHENPARRLSRYGHPAVPAATM